MSQAAGASDSRAGSGRGCKGPKGGCFSRADLVSNSPSFSSCVDSHPSASQPLQPSRPSQGAGKSLGGGKGGRGQAAEPLIPLSKVLEFLEQSSIRGVMLGSSCLTFGLPISSPLFSWLSLSVTGACPPYCLWDGGVLHVAMKVVSCPCQNVSCFVYINLAVPAIFSPSPLGWSRGTREGPPTFKGPRVRVGGDTFEVWICFCAHWGALEQWDSCIIQACTGPSQEWHLLLFDMLLSIFSSLSARFSCVYTAPVQVISHVWFLDFLLVMVPAIFHGPCLFPSLLGCGVCEVTWVRDLSQDGDVEKNPGPPVSPSFLCGPPRGTQSQKSKKSQV